MDSKELKERYFDFFRQKGHKIILSYSLIPEHDPTVLFTTAGMHPLTPYLLGQKHPQGKRVANCQKCIRTNDIDMVGDPSHLTFFEMLGNWSFGDYFKEDSITWSFEFLTEQLKLDKDKIYVTCFKGDKNSPKDIRSAEVWESLGIKKKKIFFLGKENFWGPASEYGPCGPCTEIFYDSGKRKCSNECRPGCGCGKYFEIWNNVFMEYNKTKDGFKKLRQKNVDTGMGVERTVAILNNLGSVFEINSFKPLTEKIITFSKQLRPDSRSIRIVADHIKAAVFILADGITPSNLDQGYILRRLIRRAIRHGKLLSINENFLMELAKIVIYEYKDDYKELWQNKDLILSELNREYERFNSVIEKGLKKFKEIKGKKISGKDAFLLFQSYGFPLEMTIELAKEENMDVDVKGFEREFESHQDLSRKGAEKKFKGGLADSSKETIKLHTASHLLNEALRKVLRKDIRQKGSNITPERLRFDFNFERKLTEEEIKKVESLVNKKIKEAVPVSREDMTFEEAVEKGAQAEFTTKYNDIISVYSIGDFSMEVCAGPHVENTKELGKFKIIKEESAAAGIRRIKAVLSKCL